MLLTVDIGNTNIVAGVFDGDVLRTTWRLSTDTRRMPDEYSVVLRSLFEIARIDSHEISGVAICSVVPTAQSMLADAIRAMWGIEPLLLTTDLDLGIEIRYSPVTSVGADRLANALAAVQFYGAPAVIVDFGTATTFDAISADGAYIGGAIAPGLEVSEEALVVHTAKLPRVPLIPPEVAIGRNTTESLQAGLLYGYGGLVDGLVERFVHDLGPNTHVIATGGLAEIVKPCTRTITVVDPGLTLQGLRLLYTRLNDHASSPRTREDQPVA
jgi:type III pantothenate kinase